MGSEGLTSGNRLSISQGGIAEQSGGGRGHGIGGMRVKGPSVLGDEFC